ncbi:hypothetical protein [Methanolapillus millepedarum]|uniref:Uncharacterized protein n=1 Tax=Methanolapillus millepedarum TaxID=3028296 RepID=A0AA96V6R0_9EURY|nr:hypothetical protein MsAc7_17510 [Methanosarcinaceae archaeon Ac7]
MTIEQMIYIALMIGAIVITSIVINYYSKKTGRNVREDMDKIYDSCLVIKKAADDGKFTEEEKKQVLEAIELIGDSIYPYIDFIEKSGILDVIWIKIKSGIAGFWSKVQKN